MIDVCSPSSWANFEDGLSRKTFSVWLFRLQYVFVVDFDLDVR